MIGGEESGRVGAARRFVEGDVVHHVAAERREGHTVDRLVIGRAGLGELPGDATDLHDRHAGGVHEHDGHLQHDLELVADGISGERVEGFGAIARLEQEGPSTGDPGEIRGELAGLTGEDQGRKGAEHSHCGVEFGWIGPHRLLDGREQPP